MKKWQVPLLLFAGSLLLQLAWIAALPPFRGIDEFDHAYRAAEVAHGQWVSDYVQPLHGRGDLVTVPRGIVLAASAECASYQYTGHDNCYPVRDVGDGMVTVASAAARYNPVFYWVVGTVARPFRGATALYVMRLTAAALCSAMLALVGAALSLWKRPRLAVLTVFVAMTPMVVYSTALPAPNGIEMLAGLAVWACLLGLSDTRPEVQRRLLWMAIPAAMVLATVRTLGPLWLLMILATSAGLLGWQRLGRLLRQERAVLVVATTLVGVATLAGGLWTFTQGTNSPSLAPVTHDPPSPLSNIPVQVLLWLWQTMGAFPTRDELAPTLLYAIFALVFTATAFIAFTRGTRRIRWGMLATCLSAYGVPAILVLMTYRHTAGAWQGRYELPYSIGIPLLAALALTRRPISHRLIGPLLTAGGLGMVVAQSSGVVKVLLTERKSSPLSGTSEWPIPPLWVVVALVATGIAAWTVAVWVAPSRSTPLNERRRVGGYRAAEFGSSGARTKMTDNLVANEHGIESRP